jgi:hypothetical protein
MLATTSPFPQYFDKDGTPLDSGALYFGAANGNPRTAPITVYWDSAGTQPAAQPIKTVSGYVVRNGTPAMLYANSDYSLLVNDKRGRQVFYAANSAAFSLSSQITAISAQIVQVQTDVQNAAYVTSHAGGTADAITATFTPNITALTDGMVVHVRAAFANATTTPTLTAGTTPAKTIVKGNNQALSPSDIPGAGAWSAFEYDSTLDKWELLNPASTQYAPACSGAFKNLQISTTGISAIVSVSFDELVVGDGAGLYRTLRAQSYSINTGGTVGQPLSLSTGTLATGTWYAIWVWSNGANSTATIDPSGTAPTAPTGYSGGAKTRVGWVRTDGTVNKFPLGLLQFGRDCWWKIGTGTNLIGYPVFASGVNGSISVPTYVSASLSASVPSTTCSAVVGAWMGASTSSTTLVASNNSHGAIATGTGNAQLMVTMVSPGAGLSMYQQAEIVLQTTQTLYVAMDNALCGAVIRGWKDNL